MSATYTRVSGDYNIVSVDPTVDNVNVTTNSLNLTGNLYVSGNITYINVEDLTVDDPFITVAGNNSGTLGTAPYQQQGIVARTSNSTYAGIRFDNGTQQWQLSPNVYANGAPVGNSYAVIVTGNGGGSGSSIANGTSSVNIASANGNIVATANGNAVLTITELGANFVGSTNLGNAATANYFIGDGSLLTNLTISAGTAITNGNSNVTVSANSAVSIGVAGVPAVAVFNASNVTFNNSVIAPTFQGNLVTANYFTGNGSGLTSIIGANVTGVVSYANVAYSVALANVSGIGNIASINLDGNAGNVLYGNGVFAPATGVYGNSNVAGFLAAFGSNTITTTGNVSVGNIIGNAQALTNIPGANVSGTVANATYALTANAATYATQATFAATANAVAGANVSGQVGNALVAGTVYTNAQPNITSVGNLTSLTVTGTSTLTGNVTVANIQVTTDKSIDVGNNRIMNVGYPTANTDAVTKAYVDSQTSSGFAIQDDTANTTVVSGGDTLQLYGTANEVTVAITNTDQVTFGLPDNVTITANITAGNADLGNAATVNYFIGNGSLLTSITASNVSGQVANALVAGTVYTNAQPNITSIGSLSGLIVSNASGVVNFTNTANVTLGNVSNLHITGGASGYVLSTDGAGNLAWASNGLGNVVGNTIQIGTPTDGNLTTNVAYGGWTTSTYVTDGLDDLNQVSLNIANSTYVGHSDFTANVTSGSSPLVVAFTSTFVGNATNYLWDFGDGNTSSSRNPTKTYSNALGGTFTVSFTAWNTSGTYSGNASLGAKGSVDSVTKTGFIVLFTPLPIPSFTTSPTSLDTGSSVTLTNTSQYATSFTINYGDGNSAVNPGNSWITDSHTYINSANTDALRSITLTGTNQTAGNAPPYSVTSSATNVKIYTQQSPAVTANVLTTINYLTTSGGVVSFRNDTPGSPGNTASFGAQQVYNFQWGDSTANSNVNIQTGLAGNPGAANVTHTFALTSVQQNAATTVSRVANLWLYTGYSTSPFKSANVTISIEPEVRAGFIGTANIQTDATGFTSNAQVGYLYTDYNGRDRSLFNFRNDTSPNVAFTGNVFNWTWGDTTSDLGLITFANVTHSYLNAVGSPTTGSKTVTLQANGTPGTISQSNTSTRTAYITILANPTAPPNLSSYTNVTISTASQGTSPLLAAGAGDNTGGNLPANGTSVTRVATTTPVATNANVVNANTATTGTLTAYVNNTAAGNVTFTTGGNTVGTAGALIISADRDLHIANAAVPTGFYKVFSATISNTLASLGNGYNDFQLRHSASGNTNTVGMVKDNLNSAPSLVTGNTIMVEAVSGTYRYISGIPYYNTGSPSITIASLELQNFSGQTFRSADPFILGSGTVYEGTGAVVVAQTKALATINNAGNSMLTGSNVNANIGIATNYILGNLTGNINGSNNSVSTLQANIFNVIGTSTTVQLPTKIQAYAGANSGINEQSITCTPAGNAQAAIRIVMSTAGNAPAFSDSTNFYVANAWSGAQTIAGTPEAVVRYGVLKQYAVDLSTGYLPVGPNLSTGRSGTQYFTFAFARPSLANFDIRLTTTTGIAGVWIAAPGTTIDKGGFSSPTPGFPGPTSTINGWLESFTQYAGSGVPGAGSGGNGSNGCALTGADVIPLNSAIANVGYTMTLGSQNAANSVGNNILIRIALAAGQSLTDLQIGVAT